MPLQRKGKMRAPSTCPSYWSDSCCDYAQKSHFKAGFLLLPILCAFEATFLTWVSWSLTFLVLVSTDHLDTSLDTPRITELKWDDSWRSGLQFWHCSRYAPTAVTYSVPVSHSTITILFTKSRRALWHDRKASWWNQKSSEWLGHWHSSAPPFNSISYAQQDCKRNRGLFSAI